MPMSPKDALHEQKLKIDDAIERVEQFIHEKLIRFVCPTGHVTVQIPTEMEALNFMTWAELNDRLAATYRKAGWDVRIDGTILSFSIPKQSA